MGSTGNATVAVFRPAHRSGSTHLTRKERDLLQYLRKNAGRCLSREQLLHDVWGYSNGVKSRTLDVHVQRLRRKLGPVEGSKILTVFRGGYLWADGDAIAGGGVPPVPRESIASD